MKFFYHYYCTVYKGKATIHSSGVYTTVRKIDSPEVYDVFRNTVVDLIKKDGDNVTLKDLNVVSLNLLYEDTVAELPGVNVSIPGKGV
jgi:hypothetical protein